MDAALRRLAVVGCLICFLGTAAAEPLDVAQALALASQRSGKLGGAAAAVKQSQDQVLANDGLGGPVVFASASAYSFDRIQGMDLGSVNSFVGGAHLPIPLPTLPGSVDVRLRKSGVGAGLNAVLPLYTGGRVDGLKGVLGGRAAEAVASEVQDRDEVQTTLLQRYFGVQVAASVAKVREAAKLGVGEHLASARRMEEAGLIARVERLQADAAHEAAVRDASKAQHDLALAQRALAAMVGDTAGGATQALATPLFVDTRPLEPLAGFLARGDAAHPSLAVVDAKRQQTLALNKVEDSVHLPSAVAFGRADPQDGKANWIVGVAMVWVLYDGIDRSAVLSSGHAAERRVDEIERQARQDISLLVERCYRNLDQARVRFMSLRADDALAQEVLRLRRKGLAEGLNTTLDVIDAQLNLAKVQAEQAGAAFEYSQALAALLGSTGELAQFPQWAARADIQHR